MQNIKHLYKVLVPSTLTWSFLVKQRVKLAASILRVVPLVFGHLTSSYVKVAFGFASNVVTLHRRQGPRGCALYLKACSIALQHAAGGMKDHSTWALGANIRRTRRGLPRIINPQHRVRIHLGDVNVIRFWLTLFGLYRVIEFPGKLKLKTITNPGVDISLFMEEWKSWVPNFYERVRLITGKPWTVKLTKLAPTSIPFMQKCSPNSGGFTSVMGILWDVALMGCHPGMHSAVTGWLSTVDGIELTWAFNGILKVLDAIAFRKWEQQYERIRDDLSLGRDHEGSPLSLVVNWQSGFGTSLGTLHPLLPMTFDTAYLVRSWYLDHYWGKPLWFGRLAFLQEPGKIRVVAMVSLITQTLMHPLHEWIFDNLRHIPTDGTFNQVRPVEALIRSFRGKGQWVASYDLSAATDRLPLSIQVELLKPLLGERLVSLWAYLLVSQPYGLPQKAVKYRNLGTDRVWYAVGQPMGALSSWAMLALTHHAIVQLAASKAYPNALGWFLDYAVLGDDVVIADRLVAKEYLRIMERLGVEISLAKSLVSNTSSLEFAKRTWIGGRDSSPISLAEVMVARCNLGSLGELVMKCKKFGVIRLSSVGIFLGFGYRNLAQLPVGLGQGNRLSKVLAYLCRPGGVYPMPFEAWLTSVAPGGKESRLVDLRAWVTACALWETTLTYLLRKSTRIAKVLFDVTMFKASDATYVASEDKKCAGVGGQRVRQAQGEPKAFWSDSVKELFNFEVLKPQLDTFYREWICYPYQLKLRRRYEVIDDVLRLLDPKILPDWERLEGLWNDVVAAEEGIDSLPQRVEFVERPSDAKAPSTGLINLWVRLRTLALREVTPVSSVGTRFSVRRRARRRRASG
jgi:hypothetical protein